MTGGGNGVYAVSTVLSNEIWFALGMSICAFNVQLKGRKVQGTIPELVLDGVNGYLFKPADAQELCEKIALLDDDAVVKKMGAASRARLEDRFAPQTHYDTLMRIFESVRRK